MTLVVPIVIMVLFSALYTGVYIWMRRPAFGEAKRRREDSSR
ncbi:MAG TPA: hypothetical protein VIJ40_09900 [Acidimicrobiales bacterium]